MIKTKHTPTCSECGRLGQLLEFRRDGKLTNWCLPCLEKMAYAHAALTAALNECVEALEAFSKLADMLQPLHLVDDIPLREIMPGIWPTVSDARKARSALEAAKKARKKKTMIMNGSRIRIVSSGLLLLAGCGAYRPVFDPKFIRDPVVFEADLAECQQLARSGGIDPATGAAVGAVAGAGLGAGIGAAAGAFARQAGRGAGVGAAIGGISGVLAGPAVAAQRERIIVTRCMIGRGYKPLY